MINITKLKKLASKESKISDPILPNEQGYTPVLGIHIHENYFAYLHPQKLRYLIELSRQFVKYRQWNLMQLQTVLGKWAIIMLLRRPIFSVFEAIYKLNKAKTRTVKPPYKARQEFEAVINLSPLV